MSHIEKEFEELEHEHGWKRFYSKLDFEHQSQTMGKPCDIASSDINRALNRFRDILPYDDTRVRLKKGSNDYINANYVHIPSAERRYILTQGPLATTLGHFWQMTWEENSRVIVMLTRLLEKGSSKCCQYYPDSSTEPELILKDVELKVAFVSERQYRHYTQRKLQLTDLASGESRPIIHWSEFDWPDHGAPITPEPFLQFLRDVRSSGAFDSRFGAPILHCSAGVGRSGTFVLVDSMLKLLAHSQTPREISLTETLAHIRTQRRGLIQTAEQLRFSYMTIVAGSKTLPELEESEKAFVENDFPVSSESESDELAEEESKRKKKHPKVCGRQDNIMPNSRLSEALEDINCELMRRADSVASSHQPSPASIRRLQPSPSSSEQLAPSTS